MKKEKFVLVILTTLLSIQIIIAQNYYIDRAVQSLSQSFGSIFAPIFGSGFGEILFAKILLFFLLFSIISIALNRIDLFEDNRVAHVITTLVVSIFAVRYINEGLINAILLPYTSLGAAFAIFLPLLIYSVFVHKSDIGPIGRRAAWFIYGIILLMLWGTLKPNNLGSANLVYLIGLGYVILSLLFDKHIHSYFEMGKFNKPRRLMIEQRIASLQSSVADARRSGNSKLADKFEREIKNLAKKL